MKILLACSAGMSTSLLEKSINDYMKEKGIEGKAEAHGSEKAKGIISQFDIVLLGPQVRFMLKSFEELAGDVPVAVMDPATYAMAKGDKVYEQAVALLK